MIEFELFTPVDGKPIYLQIVDFIKRGALAGTVKDGDELPSRRVLSALLGINPNTVQKAFKLLEDEELTLSRTGAKSVMLLDEGKLKKLRREVLEEDVRGVISTLKQTGIDMEEAIGLLQKYWMEV